MYRNFIPYYSTNVDTVFTCLGRRFDVYQFFNPPSAIIREKLLKFVTEVQSLQHLCRRQIRQQLIQRTGGTSIISIAFTLPLPVPLQQYVLLSDARTCDLDSTAPYRCRYAALCSKCEPEIAANNLVVNICCQHIHAFADSDQRDNLYEYDFVGRWLTLD